MWRVFPSLVGMGVGIQVHAVRIQHFLALGTFTGSLLRPITTFHTHKQIQMLGACGYRLLTYSGT